MHICAITQATAIHTSHVINKYVLETNMSTKLAMHAIYAKYLIDLYRRCRHICVTYKFTAIHHVTMGTVNIFDIYGFLIWVL